VEIHRPGVVRNWREFLKEVGIIVLGVSIALAGEEAVSYFNWKQEVSVVQDSVDDELGDALFSAMERVKIADCQKRTLERLDQLADESRGTLVIRNAPVRRMRLWGSAAWDAAVASGAIAHMRHDKRNTYANLFSFLHLFRDLNIRQEELWAKIDAYQHPRALTEGSRDRFVESVSELRALTGTMNFAAKQFIEQAKPLRLQLSPENAAELRKPLQCPLP
jgi:hypothetical protein